MSLKYAFFSDGFPYENSCSITDSDTREQVYAENRAAVCEKIRSSDIITSKVVKGFFNHPKHLHNHFIFLSGMDDLFFKNNIQKNLQNEVSMFEKYLTKIKKEPPLKQITEYVNKFYGGSLIHKAVVVIRLMAETIDGDGKDLCSNKRRF